jgi:pyruvate/2-oxoglutarate/acetoin dehydrogenase E1 component
MEIIDLRSIKPLDESLIFESIRKTGRLIIADGGWKTGGIAAEIAALISEKMFRYLKGPIVRVALPDVPAPASSALEKVYYPKAESIIQAARASLQKTCR